MKSRRICLVSICLKLVDAYVFRLRLVLTFEIFGHLFRYYRLIVTSRFATSINAERFRNPCVSAYSVPAALFAVPFTWLCGKDSRIVSVKWLSAVLCTVKLCPRLGLLTLFSELIVMLRRFISEISMKAA
ncbi:hypothetical protein M758_10G140600 [Ceratodon purpureus]|nr:hypothetical protein M758_10G140600 [Ceratodon purpureus]